MRKLPLCGPRPVSGDWAAARGLGRAAGRRRSALGIFVVLFALLLAGCGDESGDTGNTNASQQAASGNAGRAGNAGNAAASGNAGQRSDEGSIKATPNPVPAGEGNGKTTVSWSTKGDLGVVKVFVSADGQAETLFAQAPEGSLDAPWIQTGVNYEFRLYSEQSGRKRLIDKVQVARGR